MSGRPGERVVESPARVAMVHNVPELHVAPDIALEVHDADAAQLIASRRLVLLFDLDQTLVHTTDEPVKFADVEVGVARSHSSLDSHSSRICTSIPCRALAVRTRPKYGHMRVKC